MLIIAISEERGKFYMSAHEIQSLLKKKRLAKRKGIGYNFFAPTYCKIRIKMNSPFMPLAITEEKIYYIR